MPVVEDVHVTLKPGKTVLNIKGAARVVIHLPIPRKRSWLQKLLGRKA